MRASKCEDVFHATPIAAATTTQAARTHATKRKGERASTQKNASSATP